MLAAIIKEFRLLSRDLHGIAVLFLMPMVFMLIMSVALSQADEVNQNAKVALIGESSNTLNDNFALALEQQQKIYVDRINLVDLDKAENQLAARKYDVLIVNLNQQQQNLESDLPIELRALASTDQMRLLSLQGLIQKVYLQQRIKTFFDENNSTEAPQTHISTPTNIAITQLNDYLLTTMVIEKYVNKEGNQVVKPNSVQQSVPAWLIFGMFFIMIPLSNVMTCEKQTNTILRLRLAKAPAFSLLMAKLIPYFVINQLQFIGMILLGIYLLPIMGIEGFKLYGSFWNYGFLSIAISLSALGYALLVSVLAKSAEHAVVLGGGGNIIMAALGGIMVPVYMMPDVMQNISLVSPMAWALSSFHNLLLNQYDFWQILPEWFLLMGFSAIFLCLASMIYCYQLKKQQL